VDEYIDLLREEHRIAGIGDQLLPLLSRIVRSTAATHPPVEYSDGSKWTPEALEDLLHDWIAERLVGRGDLSGILAMARTEAVLRSILTTSLSQFLVNRRHRTSATNLFKRIQLMLGNDDAFEGSAATKKPAAQQWRLAGEPPVASRSDLRELVAFACELSDEELEVVRYGPTSLKSSPILREAQLKRFLQHLLDRSGGSLALGTIAEVVNRRFNLIEAPIRRLDDVLEGQPPEAPRRVEIADAARRAAARLGRNRLTLLREVHTTEDLGDAAKRLGLSPALASRRLKEALTIIGEYAESIEEARDIYRSIGESLFFR
jgi:hypothetical protein